MRTRALLVALVAIVLAGMCVRLGVWQLSRWQGKRQANAALREALARPPVELRGADVGRAELAGRRVRALGAYDESLHVLLSDQWRKEQPGVEVLTPLRLASGGALLVDRGWLPSADGIAARPQDHAEPGPLEVTGLLAPVPRTGTGARDAGWTRLPGSRPARWSVRALDADSLAAHVPGAIAGWVLRALPDPGAPALPARAAPEPADEGMHLSYAVQWCLFAIALLAGAGLVIARGRSERAAGRAVR